MEKFDKFKAFVNGKRIAVLGAGISNMPAIGFLRELGAEVSVRDRKSREALGKNAERLLEMGVELITGEGYLSGIDADIILRSPGIRPDVPELREARERGVYITSEMELFLSYVNCPVIAVTGSAGKTTTTTLISLILGEYYRENNLPGRVYTGGNIGEPLLRRLPEITPECTAVVELSSFQLISMYAKIDAAVITNISPNHLDWHTGMDEYISAKSNLLVNCNFAVLNFANPLTRSLGARLSQGITYFSYDPIPLDAIRDIDSAITFEDGKIVRYHGRVREILMHTDGILLPGRHNIENYMAALAALGARHTMKIADKLKTSFRGVKHRLEFIRTFNGVKYYNSSIDSSPDRTAAALSALKDDKLVLILGGYDKKIPFTQLTEAVLGHGNIKTVIMTGATRDKIADAFARDARTEESGISFIKVPTFDGAMHAAYGVAEIGETVLLSPSCASFDEFPNFEVRGEHFRKFVLELQ